MESDRRAGLFVSVPVLFVDDVLPSLKDTELRVLLVVMRQVRVRGQERPQAWLTHAELCRRTGRAGEAVSAAVANLCERRLIEIRDEAGRILFDAEERQRASGPRFFRLSGPLATATALRFSESNAGKPKTIDANIDVYSLRLSETLTPEQEAHIEEEKRRIRERLNRNA